MRYCARCGYELTIYEKEKFINLCEGCINDIGVY
jgi:hypothetical protein